MNTRGLRGFGALFIVLLFLTGAWAVHPEWSAQAQGKKIQGIVYDAASPQTVVSATVTLTHVHSLVNQTTTTAGNTYEFTSDKTSPGYYMLKVHADGYFDEGTAQFRYDGMTLLQFDFALTKYPERNKTLSVLVTQTGGMTWNENPYFPRFSVPWENTAYNFTSLPAPDHTTLNRKPVVSVKSCFWKDYRASPQNITFCWGTYGVLDQWAGTVWIIDAGISAALNSVPPGQRSGPFYLNFTYTYASTVAQLNHTPVVPGSYTVYKNSIDWNWTENQDWKVDVNAGTVTILQNFTWGVDRLSMKWDSTTAISGALVTLYNVTRKQVIKTNTTDATGSTQLWFWPGQWEVWTSMATYETQVFSGFLGNSQPLRVLMPSGIFVVGYASDSEGFIREGVTAFLYNTNTLTPIVKKVLRATVTGPYFVFRAYPGNFKLIVDANWHKANVTDMTITTTPPPPSTPFLDVSLEEKVDTAVIFDKSSWNNVTVYRNYSFNQDTQIPGLNPPDLRNALLQIDYTLGDGDGNVDQTEWDTRFIPWWQKNGPTVVDTQDFLATNSKLYLESATPVYSVQGTNVPSRQYPIWINTTAYYHTKGTELLPEGRPLYYLNFTGSWDTNTTVYRNNTYTIHLPYRYEMTETNYKSPGMEMQNFTRIILDPKSGTGSPRADMVVRLSANGTARARVKGPVGHYQELNSTLENYTVVVMASFNITYTADQSYDPIGNIADANFTWDFQGGSGGRRWGMDVVYNYTTGGEHTDVLLTIREAGGNITTRLFTVIVDDQSPVARLWTNLSAGGSNAHANGTTLRFNETYPVRLDATRSYDYTYDSKTGTVAEAHWDFNGDGIEDGVPPPGKIVNRTFEKPGNYTLKMWVLDSVGHRSVNATMNLIINDTTPPNPDFTIYDSSGNTVTSLTEGVEYNFNASITTDNYDSLANLTFTWDFGDGTANFTAKGFVGYNVTHNYTVFNTSYQLRLNVTDMGFLGSEPNYKVLARSITVQVDTKKRPNIAIKAASFSATPDNPEEGQEITITVTVTNAKNGGRANNVGVRFFVRTGAAYSEVTISAAFYKNGAAANNSFAADEEKQAKFTWKADIAGARPVKVVVNDPNEPYTWALDDNKIESTIGVREAGWKMPVIVGIFVFIIFGLPIIYYVVKKYRAGELALPRRKKAEEEEEAPEKEEETEKKEKKRL